MTGLLLIFRFCFTHCCHLLASRGVCCYYCLGIRRWILDSGARFTSRSRFCPCFRCHLYDQCLGRWIVYCVPFTGRSRFYPCFCFCPCDWCLGCWTLNRGAFTSRLFLSLFPLPSLLPVPGALNFELCAGHSHFYPCFCFRPCDWCLGHWTLNFGAFTSRFRLRPCFRIRGQCPGMPPKVAAEKAEIWTFLLRSAQAHQVSEVTNFVAGGASFVLDRRWFRNDCFHIELSCSLSIISLFHLSQWVSVFP